ncbi:MAG: DEAD/DEAH box helicase [Parachlamydiales bacterium]|nr:DEAD/DEAH box helicase [Parachlamydiales bacterium]
MENHLENGTIRKKWLGRMLTYRVERKGRSLLVRIEPKGSKRVLYLDTLKAASHKTDAEAIAFLTKLHLKTSRSPDTLTFDRIEVAPQYADEALRLMRGTGRMIGEVDAPEEKPLQAQPRLVLKESSGSFANLWIDYQVAVIEFHDFSPLVEGKPRLKKEEEAFEKDLIEAGFLKKIVGDSQYFCPKDKVKEAITLLLDVGWQIIDPLGKPVSKQIAVTEENGRIAIRSSLRALIDHKLQMEGVWEGEVLYLKKNRIAALSDLIEGANWDETLLKCAQGFKQGASLKAASVGPGFRGKLLPYQQKGVDWLAFLYEWGFSALLADEMGLGKTVQVLAFLSLLRTNLPVLIVAPTSLLFNWRLEIEKFLPGRVVELISYAELRLKDFSQTEYEVIILDESNAIKTASTQTARAAFKLKGKFKICISGTPMENRLDEIWSQFHFLMPGLIEKNAERIQHQVRPFILRRKKEEVQIDLPEKIEQIAWIEMNEDQKQLYETAKKGLRLDGMGRMEILEAILRLRQIATDPRLVGSPFQGAKIEQLIQDVEEALGEKRKILIFSQFTSMLQLIREQFPKALYLDGTITGDKRGELVKAFQEDPDCNLFLLSLKAGGVGLNLTAADYVFLVDPWWNEAVEKQAIDRAHRIGQKNTVIAKRYLTLSSVEEKMLKLKSEKMKAADQLLDFEGGNFTENDLISLLS